MIFMSSQTSIKSKDFCSPGIRISNKTSVTMSFCTDLEIQQKVDTFNPASWLSDTFCKMNKLINH